MKPNKNSNKFKHLNEDEEAEVMAKLPKVNTAGDATNFKGSIDFQVFINEIGM